MKAIRDPIHNIILFDKQNERLILDLLDTPEFQRLRHIKQLGFSSYTYPGAEHTRFAHSLGVAHLTRRFIDKISSNKVTGDGLSVEELTDNRLLVSVAALLHDIGHGPFSHALEGITGIKHEKWTIKIIKGNTCVNKIIRHYNISPDEVAEIIQRTHKSSALVKILSSQLDADRTDYLLRDSVMTGAGYGSFDLEWLINVLRLGKHEDEVEIGLDLNKGQSIAEDYVMARYYMYKNVYFHKTTRSAELMMSSVFKRAKELESQGLIEFPAVLKKIINVQEENSDDDILQAYLELNEHLLWTCVMKWKDCDDLVLKDLCGRILNRNLYKALPQGIDIFKIIRAGDKLSAQLKIPVEYLLLVDSAESGCYKDPYILIKPSQEDPKEREASEQIFLFDNDGRAEELSRISKVIGAMRDESINIKRYYVPGEYIENFLGE
ncbi:MAG: HD domain-containing protein [Syntrophomonadaceae bacterium]|nr:HD domain-containing protein [Syntrophomonadaceae bacterium]MDD4549945.1 HD domain-containing protein [Syntrophomonadaceae bacterium]